MPRGKTTKPHKRGASSIDTQLGARVRAVRLDRNMSQEALGTVIGVSFQQIQKYEKGSNRLSVSRAYQIAVALKIKLDDLIGNAAPAIDGFAFDDESYKLAREFVRLPDRLKTKFRSLMASINDL